jgi:2-polyprenyl-3-methyl-5-hydroxy-6-metoxy-1,4-benzoquinol methylase
MIAMGKVNHTPFRTCPVCDGTNILELIDIPQVPVFCNVLWDSHQEALDAPRGDIQLGYCTRCSHIYNQRFDPQLVAYAQGYENSLHFSPRFQAYAKKLAARLVADYALYNRNIIEIGAGQGDFLELLCALGDNHGTGFDPSFLPNPVLENHPRLAFIADYYSEKFAHHQADFILSRHVLEHIHTPDKFIASLRRVIGPRHQITVFFEVPNALYTLRAMGIWDLIFEHFSYFTPHSLVTLFKRNQFQVLKSAEVFNGQFLILEAKPSDQEKPVFTPTEDEIKPLTQDAMAFKDNYQRKYTTWQGDLKAFSRQRKKVVVWGAGSKGVTFLNVLRDFHQIEFIVDINPRKENKFVAGSGQQIVPPKFLASYQPDIVIIMNPNYQVEIQSQLDPLGVTADIYQA